MERKRNKRFKHLKELETKEMWCIRGGYDKPVKPKSPGEVIILTFWDNQ